MSEAMTWGKGKDKTAMDKEKSMNLWKILPWKHKRKAGVTEDYWKTIWVSGKVGRLFTDMRGHRNPFVWGGVVKTFSLFKVFRRLEISFWFILHGQVLQTEPKGLSNMIKDLHTLISQTSYFTDYNLALKLISPYQSKSALKLRKVSNYYGYHWKITTDIMNLIFLDF